MLPNLSALRGPVRSADVDAGTFPSVTDQDTTDVTNRIAELLKQSGTMHVRLYLRYIAHKGIVLSLHSLPVDRATYKQDVERPTYTWPVALMSTLLYNSLHDFAKTLTPSEFPGGGIAKYNTQAVPGEPTTVIVFTSSHNHGSRISKGAKINDPELKHMADKSDEDIRAYLNERDQVAKIMTRAMKMLRDRLNTDDKMFSAVSKDIIAFVHEAVYQPQLRAKLLETAEFSSPYPTPSIAAADTETTELARIDFKMLVGQKSNAPSWVVKRYLMHGVPKEEPPNPEPDAVPDKRLRTGS